MGRLWVAAVECNCQEVNRHLKKQFIHGLNELCMLEEVIKELTATKNDDHMTSRGVSMGQEGRGTEGPNSSVKYTD